MAEQQPNTEQWRPVVGWEHSYEVSNMGRARSVDREYVRSDGVRSRRKGRVLKPVTNTNGRHQVYLCEPGAKQKPQQVHRLVLEAFVGPCPDGSEACHNNDDHTDNRLENLRWDTRVANMKDRLRNGIPFSYAKTHCPSGHEYDDINTYVNPNSGSRLCRECHRVWDRTKRRAA